MIIRIEVILVEIVLISLKIIFMLTLWARSSVLAHWRLVVDVSSVHFLWLIIFLLMLVYYASRASESLAWWSRARTNSTRSSNPSLVLYHHRDFLDKLKEVDAVLWVPVHDFLSLDVAEIIFKYLLTKKVNERLNIFSHLSHILSSRQLREINFWESCLEELNVELITKEHCNVIYGLLDAQVP